MKKFIIALLLVVLLHTAFSGAVGAKHLEEYDQTISIETGLNLVFPYNTAELSYNLQERLHKKLKETTGIEIDYYYYWIEIDGQPVLAVDPIKFIY